MKTDRWAEKQIERRRERKEQKEEREAAKEGTISLCLFVGCTTHIPIPHTHTQTDRVKQWGTVSITWGNFPW